MQRLILLAKNKKIVLAFGLLVFFVIGLMGWYMSNKYQAHYSIDRTVKYSLSIQNTSNTVVPEARFWVYAPVKQTSTQQVVDIQSSHDYVMENEADGNQKLVFTVKNLPPFGVKVISITTNLKMSDQPNREFMPKLESYLVAEKFIESNDADIVRVANSLQASGENEVSKKAFEWVANKLQDAGYTRQDRGALYALQHKKGDCTEYAYLYTALNRANHIASRAMAGFVYDRNTVLRARDYHNWTQVFLDDAWYNIDPHKKQYRKNQSHYIAMRIINSEHREGESAQSLFGGNDEIKIVMN